MLFVKVCVVEGNKKIGGVFRIRAESEEED